MRASEFLIELRDRMYQYIRSIVPTWPEYVVQDWLYKGRGKNKNYTTDSRAVKDEIIEMIADAGLSPNVNPWQLVPNMKFTMDMFEPKSKRKLIGRAGGTSDMGMGIPKDAERHATQAALIQQGGVSREPAILIKFGNGYELLEGWHRTIQHFARYPDGYVGPAYVAVAQSRPGITESMAADQVLDYVKRAHAPEAFDIEYSITDHPEWELKSIPLSQLNLDPDGEEPDPYNRVNWVDNDKVQELIPQIEAVLKRMPIVVDSQGWIIDGNHRAVAAVEAGMTSVPAYVPVKPVVAEGESNDTAISLSKLGKFHPGADTLAEFVPERTTAQYALHPDKWESTFYSLTNKDSDKLKYYGPKKISIPPGTLVGDMAIANKFYRAKTSEEKQQYAELYKASLQPYPVDVSEYRMPELLIPKQGVAENFADGKNPGRKGLAKRSGVNTKASVSSLRKTAKNSSGEKQRMAHWLANMKAGRAKAKKK